MSVTDEIGKSRWSTNKQEFEKIHEYIELFRKAKENQNSINLIMSDGCQITGRVKECYYTDKDESGVNCPPYVLRGVVCIETENQDLEYFDILDIQMIINEVLWSERQYEILVSCVHHFAYYRTLSKVYTDLQVESEFWKWTIDAHILRANINWCMIFGTDNSELHWKKAIADKCSQSTFRNHLLNILGFTHDQWEAFRSNMMEFRNKYAAHRNLPYPPTPIMDTALRVVTTYDEWFRDRLDATFDEPSLQKRYDRLMRTSVGPLRHAVSLGPTLDQEYEGRVPPSS